MKKSDKYYNSYNVELASTYIQSVEIENMPSTYSLAYDLKYNIHDKTTTLMIHAICCM